MVDELPPLAVYRYSVLVLPAPAPAENAASAADRDQAVAEWKHFAEWPFELEVEVEQGEAPIYLYGAAARTWLSLWFQRYAT